MTIKKSTPTRINGKLMQVLRGSPYFQNPQRIVLIGRVVFLMSTPNKEIALFPMFVGGREVGNDKSRSGPLLYKKPSKASFTLKRSSNRARRLTKTPQKLGESWDGHTLKCCKTLLIKGCKGKWRPFSKAASKKQTILGTGTT